MNNAFTYELIDVLLDNPEQYKFQLGVIFSQIPLSNIPEHIRRRLFPLTSDMELSVLLRHNAWEMCRQGEENLEKALTDGAIMLLNDVFVVKFVGKVSGIALRDETFSNGITVKKGLWYSPTNQEEVKRMFDVGNQFSTNVSGDWLLLRPIGDIGETESGSFVVRVPAEEILKKAQKAVTSHLVSNSLPDTIEGMSRQDYRLNHKEDQRTH